MRRALDYLKALGFFALLAVAAAWFANRAEVSVSGAALVIDGDSLVVERQEIRLEGIDAPELSQRCSDENGQSGLECGQLAKAYLNSLTGESVDCKGWEFDRYQRLLAQCNSSGIQINQTMVEQGWAVSYGAYEPEEEAARKARRGIWAGDFDSPAKWRKAQKRSAFADWLSGLKFW